MKKTENFVHVRFENEESREHRREVLGSELHLIKIIRAIKNYKDVRKKELDNKLIIQQKIKELSQILKTIELTLPKPKIPKKLERKENEVQISIQNKESQKEKTISPIERELLEIKSKLDALQ